MPLPVRIDYEYERPAWATYLLILANVFVFVATLGAKPDDLLPYVLQTDDFRLHQIVTSAFLHLGLFHLVGNMIFLAVFGRYTEARLGWWRYLLLYFACEVGADVAFLVEAAARHQPSASVGASGAIAGLMGFTLHAAPRAQVRVFWRHTPDGDWPQISAWFMLGGWIVFQVVLAMAGPYSGVAVWAHLGGLLTGFVLSWVMHRPALRDTPFFVERALGGGSLDEGRRARTARFWGKAARAIRERRAAEEAARQEAASLADAPADDVPLDLPPEGSAPADAHAGRPAAGGGPYEGSWDERPLDLPPEHGGEDGTPPQEGTARPGRQAPAAPETWDAHPLELPSSGGEPSRAGDAGADRRQAPAAPETWDEKPLDLPATRDDEGGRKAGAGPRHREAPVQPGTYDAEPLDWPTASGSGEPAARAPSRPKEPPPAPPPDEPIDWPLASDEPAREEDGADAGETEDEDGRGPQEGV